MNSPVRLLHVEDDSLDRRALRRLVRQQDLPWEVNEAATLAEARELLSSGRFDLAIVDYHLPDGDGTALFGEAVGTPFILLTGTLEEHLALRVMERGADDYLPKDTEQHYLKVLPFAVEKTLRRQRLHEAEQRLTVQLRESEEQLRLLVENVRGYALFMLDPDGRVASWNRGAEQIKGYTAKEIIGNPFEVCYTPEAVADGVPARALREAKEQGRYVGENWLVRKDGSRFWASISVTAVYGEAGELRGFVKVTQDLTDRKRMEDELRELNRTLEDRVALRSAEAEQKTAQLRRLHAELTSAEHRERKHLARMLHDGLQQLLVAAKLRLGVIDTSSGDSDQHARVKQIDELLNQAVEACRSLTAELVPPVLYDRGLVAGLHWLARHMRTHHDFNVAVQAQDQAEPTREDLRIMLFEAARELVFNAVKHAQVSDVEVALSYDSESRHTCLEVRDEGPGFDPSKVELQSTTDSGYGLFNLRERVQAVGGVLKIDSSPGRGTRVTVRVPLSVGERELGEQPRLASASAGSRSASNGEAAIRVLLADDHKAMRDGIASLLAGEAGMTVVGEAADGKQVLDLAQQLRPNVVVMDVTMPEVDGVEATRRIRQTMPGVGVVGLSMHNDPSVRAAMTEAGASVYLSKDGPLDEMVDAIRACAASIG
ncbi:response regulator [Phycisphaerales bacterium AB-hyl4]|uniref:Oxygen sensor histidine kinase NreB n=1 Tax=Natronomicrosphaera hydrolytica TaxID=3242702 RepID=A0ABV4U958_9BACT